MPKVFVKPARAPDGGPLVVRDPTTRLPIPEGGMEIELDRTIRRRIADGDLIEIKNALVQTSPSDAADSAESE